MMRVDFMIVHFMVWHLDWDLRNLRVKILRKSPLHMNLTKWLSRCEGSFHKGKDQKTRYGDNGCKA